MLPFQDEKLETALVFLESYFALLWNLSCEAHMTIFNYQKQKLMYSCIGSKNQVCFKVVNAGLIVKVYSLALTSKTPIQPTATPLHTSADFE